MRLPITIFAQSRPENRCQIEVSCSLQSGGVNARRGFGGDGFSSCAEQVREKSFWHVANDGVDKPGKRKWHGAAEFDGFDLNVSAAGFFLDMPPGAESPHVTMCIGRTKSALVRLAVSFDFRDARGAGTNSRSRGRVVRDLCGKIHVENGGDGGLVVELQKDIAGVSVLGNKFRLPHIWKIVVFLVIEIRKNGFRLRERRAGEKCDADPVMNDAAGDGDFFVVIEGVKLLEIKLATAKLCVNGLAACFGKSIDVEELAGQEVGVHAGLSFLAVAMVSGQSLWLGFVGSDRRRQNAQRGRKDD